MKQQSVLPRSSIQTARRIRSASVSRAAPWSATLGWPSDYRSAFYSKSPPKGCRSRWWLRTSYTDLAFLILPENEVGLRFMAQAFAVGQLEQLARQLNAAGSAIELHADSYILSVRRKARLGTSRASAPERIGNSTGSKSTVAN